MYLDYQLLSQDSTTLQKFYNKHVLPNLNGSDTVLNYALNLYPVELHIHALSHISSRLKNSFLNNTNEDLNINSGIYDQCFGSYLSQRLQNILASLSPKANSHLEYPQQRLLPASGVFHSQQVESEINRINKQLISALTLHWKTYKINNTTHSNVATINLKPIDIGSKGSAFILKESENIAYDSRRTFTLEGLNIVHNALNALGFVVIKNVLQDKDIERIRECFNASLPRAKDIAFSILEEDSNINPAKYTRGRTTCSLRGTTYESKLRGLQSFWIPLVHYTMPIITVSFDKKKQTQLERKLYVSWINLTLSDPLSDYEYWHKNNSKYGITVVIPLDSRAEEDGQIELIPNTHSSNTKPSIFTAIRKGPVGININPGDILIYNSTILHRYTMNRSFDCKSDLVYQYDFNDTPPPGQGYLSCVYNRFLASFIVFCNKFI